MDENQTDQSAEATDQSEPVEADTSAVDAETDVESADGVSPDASEQQAPAADSYITSTGGIVKDTYLKQ